MRRATRTGCVLAAIGVLVSLSGCPLQLAAPEIALTVEPAYRTVRILVPYRLTGEGPRATARWSLGAFNGSDYEEIDSSQVELPSGSSGVLELEDLAEGRYEIVFRMLTTRNDSYEPVPYLTQRREFTVDRTVPEAVGIVRQYYEDGTATAVPPASLDPARRVELEIVAPAYDPEFESPTRILYTVNDPRSPVSGEDEYGGRIVLWDANEYEPQVIVIVAVDEAGNRSSTVVDTW